jgi:Ca2+-binding EF-hand superfamily protein
MHGGVGLEVRVKELNLQFKQQIQSRGGNGIRTLGRIFRQFDNNGNRKLDIAEFEQALATYGIFTKKQDLTTLMKYYDVDGDGNVSFEEFMRGLKDDLTPRRAAMV